MKIENHTLTCQQANFIYNKGYIALPCLIAAIPQTFEIGGIVLTRKDSFHVSLVCVKNLLKEKPDAEQAILTMFCEYVNKNPISFEHFTGTMNFVEDEERKSIVAFCQVKNLLGLADHLSRQLGINVPYQPAHITLYTLQPNVGIGLNSQFEVDTKSRPIQVPKTLEVLFA